MTKMRKLADLGQSIWLDYIRRSFIASGELDALIEQGLRGMTSNPSIFAKAISESSDYDQDLQSLAKAGKDAQQIYEALAFEDVMTAADRFGPVYDQTRCLDGYVSLEVSPDLAHDTEGTISEAKRLFQALGRPNVMIKVPATKEGLPAITELIASGVNVNVTLLFSVDVYKEVAEAYVQGLERLLAHGPEVSGGRSLSEISSVASFFVSRVDSAVDKELESKGMLDLQGKAAVANAKLAYAAFAQIFSGSRWKRLQDQGAKVQRLLWASTGTKNPEYPDTMYVDQLIGPNTVNTLPPHTLQHFLDHGQVRATLTQGLQEAAGHLERLASQDIHMQAITAKLLEDGIEAFAQPFHQLMTNIEKKRQALI